MDERSPRQAAASGVPAWAGAGSFARTAQWLHLMQAGISHLGKALETETGCRLLDKLRKKSSAP